MICVQCENSPPMKATENTNVTFSLTLDGTFEDVRDTAIFTYYKPIKVTAIKP